MIALTYTALFAKVTFYYRNQKPSIEVIIPVKELRQYITRIIDRSGVLVLQNKKIDLILVEKVSIEFFYDKAINSERY